MYSFQLCESKVSYLYSLSSFFRLSSFALQMSTSDSVKYIHNLCRHISNTAGKLLGIEDTLLLMSFVPRRLTVVMSKMSLKRKRQRSFLIQGEELVVTRSCLRRARLAAARSLWPNPWINTSSCLTITIDYHSLRFVTFVSASSIRSFLHTLVTLLALLVRSRQSTF